MILDSSALVALLLEEPGWERVAGRMETAPHLGVGAPTLVETTIVLSAKLARDARPLVARLIQEGEVDVFAFHDAHYALAVEAWLQYGKGRHPAALNFGDCMTYAIAKLSEQPLLCVGDDFPATDLRIA